MWVEFGGRIIIFLYAWVLHMATKKASNEKAWGLGRVTFWRFGLKWYIWILLGLAAMGSLLMYTVYHILQMSWIVSVNAWFAAIPNMVFYPSIMICCIIDMAYNGCSGKEARHSWTSGVIMFAASLATVGTILWAQYSPINANDNTIMQSGFWMIFAGQMLGIIFWVWSYLYASDQDFGSREERARITGGGGVDMITTNVGL